MPGIVYNIGFGGSCGSYGMLCGVVGVSVVKVGDMLSALICFSRLELTREDHTSVSNSQSEETVEKLSSKTR